MIMSLLCCNPDDTDIRTTESISDFKTGFTLLCGYKIAISSPLFSIIYFKALRLGLRIDGGQTSRQSSGLTVGSPPSSTPPSQSRQATSSALAVQDMSRSHSPDSLDGTNELSSPPLAERSLEFSELQASRNLEQSTFVRQ